MNVRRVWRLFYVVTVTVHQCGVALGRPPPALIGVRRADVMGCAEGEVAAGHTTQRQPRS